MRLVTLDTNVLIYAIDEKDPQRQDVALRVIDELRRVQAPISLQVVGEFFHVAVRKFRIPPKEVSVHARALLTMHSPFTATAATTQRAIEMATSGAFSIWDANLLSAAEAAGCTHILTEDMGDGQMVGRLEIVNPFSGDALSERAREILSL